MTIYDSYVICTAPRSGSTLLCKLLTVTRVAGRPASYFHRPAVEDWQQRLGIVPDAGATERAALDAVFRAAIREGNAGTGVFGLRLQAHSLKFFLPRLAELCPEAAGDVARFRQVFGETLFVYLQRADKLAQAVSYLKAEQTGLWHVAADGSELERLAPHRDPAYDREAIRAVIETMEGHDRAWEDWFAREGVRPLRISYDALSSDPLGVLRGVLERLGLESEAACGVVPGVRKLADETSRNWVERYRSGR